jgi:4-amino-4-deoxy-L-arabinose transferase-like glycosyltransferase
MDSRQPDEVTSLEIVLGSAAILIVAAAVYFWKLGSAPLYLAPDEVIIANDAFSLATTGHTLDGSLLPLYVFVEISRNWFMPAIYYLQALFLQVLPLAESSIRTPSVVVALATIVLTMAVARRAIGRAAAILVSAMVLACAPSFFILSRYALDYTYPLPLILAWLYCVLTALQRPRAAGWFLLAGLCLGIGWYTYISSMIMMPVYAAITVVVMLMHKRSWREMAVFAGGFVIPLTFFVVWASQHPEAFQQTAVRYDFLRTRDKMTAAGLLSRLDLAAMINRYRNFFGIEFLFKLGDVYLPFSTRTTGVFVPATSILLVIGTLVAITRRTAGHLLILFGFLTAPLAASILVDEGAIRRATAMLVFGALLAAIGAARLDAIERIRFFRPLVWLAAGAALLVGLGYLSFTLAVQGRISETATRVSVIGVALVVVALLSSDIKHGRLLLMANIAVILMQFATVVRDYHGEYVARLAPWLQGNVRGAVVGLIDAAAQHPEAPIYVTSLHNGQGFWDLHNRYMPPYWRFYATKLGRADLISKAVFMLPYDPIDSIPKGSLVLGNGEDPNMRRLVAEGATTLADVEEVDREPVFRLLLK